MATNKPDKHFSRKRVKWARDHSLLVFRTLREERNRVQIDRLQRKHFGAWSDGFSSLEKCRGRVMICLLGKTVIGYQAIQPYSSRGNPFSADKQVMRFTFIVVREDSKVKARGLGIGTELLRRSLDLAWSRGYDAVYSYTTAYELLGGAGFRSHGGASILAEAKHVRNLDPDQGPPLLFVMDRPEGYISPY
ncbi:MAG: GNAT family N-acetyltransferase [bacterium]|nr:GNAT family N-acetyltransferase [bacterium]MDT8396876.1 GNAT family N-acetyltransferase [bacterium]